MSTTSADPRNATTPVRDLIDSGVRHVLVSDGTAGSGRVSGIVSIRDVVGLLLGDRS